ncbi:MAG: DUF1592 domain-containing protein [Planctomycetaceae bacterium]|nr:DUF1592 domain-containing protein [Planctomycetales bacterium]MCB9925166.1 DUF1592 domain-containing protein [Planctomycetaceae bacterium]
MSGKLCLKVVLPIVPVRPHMLAIPFEDRRWPLLAIACLLCHFLSVAACAQTTATTVAEPGTSAQQFQSDIQPLLQQHCFGCHNVDEITSGVRVDHLDGTLPDSRIRLWEAIEREITNRKMPPPEEAPLDDEEFAQLTSWTRMALKEARSRPTPKNGLMRRLTVAQYRNTLRDLLGIEDHLTEILPPDAVSRDGFVNNHETLQLTPLLAEACFDIAEAALNRCLVDESAKPTIQNFRMDLGRNINPSPCPDDLVLGALSMLLNNNDFMVTQLSREQPFDYNPFFMKTKYRFIEGYQGNDTVRGWREYDSIYHSVFACMRGTPGYPKGDPWNIVPEGLLLRPAIPSAELFQVESTYGPKANFKISLRELPEMGKFRVTVNAARYDDGLLLEPGTASRISANSASPQIVIEQPQNAQQITLSRDGIYQVDVFPKQPEAIQVPPDDSRLDVELVGHWTFDATTAATDRPETLAGQLVGDAHFTESPFQSSLSLDGDKDSFVVPRDASMDVGDGDFTVAAWIFPRELRQSGIFCLGKYSWTHGWYFDMPNGQGVLRIETAGPDNQSNGTVVSRPGTIRANRWQHVAAVVRRGENNTRLFVNGFQVASGTIAPQVLDNPKVSLHIGRIQDAQQFKGEIDEVYFYRRALSDAELQALLENGRQFVSPPPAEKPQALRLFVGQQKSGNREFSGELHSPAFVAMRLEQGPLTIQTAYSGQTPLERLVLTPLSPDDEIAQRFAVFESRSPRVGVRLGLRRDCGSTLTQVGKAQTVDSREIRPYMFESAILNYPSPDVEKDNVNYLAGIREIGVRSEYTDGRDMPRLLIRSIEFEGPYYDAWPPSTHRQIFFDSPLPKDSPEYAYQVITKFAQRAYRRPLTNLEVQQVTRVFEESRSTGNSFGQSVRDALLVVLTSPQFLMLIERSAGPEPEPLDQYELASKLSYFLWNAPPDQELLDCAEGDRLYDELDRQTDRLIDDPRFYQFANEYVPQWLNLEKLAVLEPDRKRFPELTRDVKLQLAQEPIWYVNHLVRQNRPVSELIAADYIIANEVVASYYDLGNKTERGLDFVRIAHNRDDLGGVLSQAGPLAGLSDGREPNPIKRGAWMARKIIAEPPADPPPNVPQLGEENGNLTLRERLELHRDQPGCAKCHSGIDPWGLPFEQYDAGGRFRRESVAADSTLPDQTEVQGVASLKRYLTEERLDQVAFGVLKHLSIYASGRSLTYNEIELLRQKGVALRDDGYRMRDLIHFVVHSPIFLEK